jgi:hypothetical protein
MLLLNLGDFHYEGCQMTIFDHKKAGGFKYFYDSGFCLPPNGFGYHCISEDGKKNPATP